MSFRRREYLLHNKLSAPRVVLPLLPRPANPVEITPTFTPYDIRRAMAHRYVDCRAYDKCLDFAVAAAWVNFSCRCCLVFKVMKKLAREERARVLSQSIGGSHAPAVQEAQGVR